MRSWTSDPLKIDFLKFKAYFSSECSSGGSVFPLFKEEKIIKLKRIQKSISLWP